MSRAPRPQKSFLKDTCKQIELIVSIGVRVSKEGLVVGSQSGAESLAWVSSAVGVAITEVM